MTQLTYYVSFDRYTAQINKKDYQSNYPSLKIPLLFPSERSKFKREKIKNKKTTKTTSAHSSFTFVTHKIICHQFLDSSPVEGETTIYTEHYSTHKSRRGNIIFEDQTGETRIPSRASIPMLFGDLHKEDASPAGRGER